MGFRRAQVVFAHPDDAEFFCGGTIAAWVAGGADVEYVCATDGSAGWNGPERSRDEIARVRAGELADAARLLGVGSVRFLGYTDGTLEPNLDLRRAITREVRRFRPDVIVAPDPSRLWFGRGYINHPDHRAVGEAVLAVVACDAPTRPQFPELLQEGLEPFEVQALWLATGDDDGNEVLDIGDHVDVKIRALRTHVSQMENMGGLEPDRLREWWRHAAKDRDFEYAERFHTFSFVDGEGE